MKNNLILKLFSCFIAFVLIPIILLNIAIFLLIGNIKESTISSSMGRMAQSQYYLNQIVGDSLAAVQRLSQNRSVFKLAQINKGLSLRDYNDVLLAAQAYMRSSAKSTEAFSVNILYHANDILLTAGGVCIDLEQFYGKNYVFGNLSLSELKKSGNKSNGAKFYPYFDYIVNGLRETGILYSCISSGYTTEDKGSSALVILREAPLYNLLSVFAEGGGMAYIMDNTGTLLYQVGNESIPPVSFAAMDMDNNVDILSDGQFGADHVCFYSQSVLGLQIVSVIPKNTLFLQANNLLIFVWILNGAALIMCTILSIVVARYNGKRINRTLAFLPEYQNVYSECKKHGIYAMLQTSIGNLVETNDFLHHALQEQQLYARSAFWEKITTADVLTKETVVTLCQNAGMELNTSAYCVLIIVLRSKDNQDWIDQLDTRKYLLHVLNKDHWLQNYVCNVGIEQTVLLYRLTEREKTDYQGVISQRLTFLKELNLNGFTLICVGSHPFTIPAEISPAYFSCRNLLNNLTYREIAANDIVWCDDVPRETKDNFYFQDELKSKIVIGIKTGQRDLIKSSFHKILDDNFIERQINPEMRALLIAKLKITLMEAYDPNMGTSSDQILKKVDSVQTDATLFSVFLRTSLEMCEYYSAKLRRHDDKLREKITEYINRHFCEYSFCLASVAEYCALSESYFSLIFQEIFGEPFSSYVGKKRMSHAKYLLQNTDLTVNSVSEEIGYSNTNAFRKAFKKFYGSSPIQIRQSGDSEK